ncbi:MAG: ABC transporter substrate-binding protein [Ruminococcaceae bacterium]|nr:ABC transporter substrate-binding protein [Oscillospiraceae bacterium]
MAKRLIAVFLALMLAFSMSSCAYRDKNGETDEGYGTSNTEKNETPVNGGILNLCIFEVDSLNPLSTKNESNLDVLRLMFDGLFNVNQDFSVTNNLCESYTISEDGLSYSFKIKDGIAFHDGAPLTAEDVDASFKLIEEAQSPYRTRFDNVESSHASSMTWHVTLKTPVINFPALLDFPILPAADAHTGNDITKIDYIPNGTGIYRAIQYKETKELILKATYNHFSGKYPHIPEIRITFAGDRDSAISMFENLHADVICESVANPDEYSPKRDLIKSITYPKNKLTFLGINNQKPILISPLVRQAISMCIDKNTIVNNTKTRIATPTDIPINPRFCYYNKDIVPIPFDTARANLLLSQDGFADTDSDGSMEKHIYGEVHRLKVDILVNSENNQRIKIAETIKSALEKAGFAVTITIVDFNTYTSRIASRNYDLFVGSMNISQNNDLSFMLQTDVNMFGISNEGIDSKLNQLKVVSNPSVISDSYRNLSALLSENIPIAGIYYDNGILLCDKKIRGNINPAESNVFLNICEWYIKE